jgi:tRNA dimethylallyltransferase
VREVKRLLKRKLSPTAKMALGIREIAEHLEGRASLDEALERLKINTRRYAKRQQSWFRHEKGIETVPVAPHVTPKEIAEEILKRFHGAGGDAGGARLKISAHQSSGKILK